MEKLYDVRAGPFEINNRVGGPKQDSTSDSLLERLSGWIDQMHDFRQESEMAYDANVTIELTTPNARSKKAEVVVKKRRTHEAVCHGSNEERAMSCFIFVKRQP